MRREFMAGAAALVATSDTAWAKPTSKKLVFPRDFIWGAATAGHQVEGNNVNSDSWFLEHLPETTYAEPSGDAANSFQLWPADLDLAKSLNLNAYRFSLEWSRIEPEPGQFSVAMLDHYKAIIEGCHQLGMRPLVTFNHFTAPRWFAAEGGWTNDKAPENFARFCGRAAQHLGQHISHALTFNEPNLAHILRQSLPAIAFTRSRAMADAAAHRLGVRLFAGANNLDVEDLDCATRTMIEAHRLARQAIKDACPALPVGVSLAMPDDQAAGSDSMRDAVRERAYGPWLRAAHEIDYLGVQNYERKIWGASGPLPPPAGGPRNHSDAEVYAPSLAGAVRYAHEASGLPIMVTEHGVGTDDDKIRARLIPEALVHLHKAMADGVPVLGYVHWSLIDNFEWVFGFRPKFGLCSVDRQTFARTPKPSAAVFSAIAKASAVDPAVGRAPKAA
jgi:beta-glucosidase